MLTSNGWKTLVLVILPVWNGGITKCVCVCVCFLMDQCIMKSRILTVIKVMPSI